MIDGITAGLCNADNKPLEDQTSFQILQLILHEHFEVMDSDRAYQTYRALLRHTRRRGEGLAAYKIRWEELKAKLDAQSMKLPEIIESFIVLDSLHLTEAKRLAIVSGMEYKNVTVKRIFERVKELDSALTGGQSNLPYIKSEPVYHNQTEGEVWEETSHEECNWDTSVDDSCFYGTHQTDDYPDGIEWGEPLGWTDGQESEWEDYTGAEEADWETEEESWSPAYAYWAVQPKGAKGSPKGRGRGRGRGSPKGRGFPKGVPKGGKGSWNMSPKLNPAGFDGEPKRCDVCSSMYHLRAECPRRGPKG